MLRLALTEADLWGQFSHAGNEMIITKHGRCMFPLLRLQVLFDDLRAYNDRIAFGLMIEPVDRYKWKYRSGAWRPVGESQAGEVALNAEHIYQPTESPNSGLFWSENGLSFSKVKLTNSPFPQERLPSNYFILSSFHHYRPVILYECLHGEMPREVALSTKSPRIYVDGTDFIAVTHYQNDRITEMKKSHNPHAKGFLNATLMAASCSAPNTPPPSSPINLKHEHEHDGDEGATGDLDGGELEASWILSQMGSEQEMQHYDWSRCSRILIRSLRHGLGLAVYICLPRGLSCVCV